VKPTITSKTFFREGQVLHEDDAICVTRAKAAQLLGISMTTLDRLTRTGELPCVRLPGRVLFRPETLRGWAIRRETQALPQYQPKHGLGERGGDSATEP
jgi:excisionase family DNA binding protein